MLSNYRYCGKLWAVTPQQGGFLLVHEDRVLLAQEDGVWECSRDGMATPLVKMDGSPNVYERLLASQAQG